MSFMPTHMPRVGRLPLTPPEIWGQQPSSAGGFYPNSAAFYPISNDSGYSLDPYNRHSFGKPSQLQAERFADISQAQGYNSSGTRPAYNYGAIGAPILPPLRIPNNVADRQVQRNHSASSTAVREQPKEEKVAGGVAAHLDYEIEHMVDFVADMAQGMYALFSTRLCLADVDVARSIQPTSGITPEFRKYVSQVLTSTRLPSSTIFLALHYLATRLQLLQSKNVYTSSNGHLYHMLTIALMLASKFLDDNTFQNRSWAEVSHIAVAELNKEEREWLGDMCWNLHFDVEDPQGFQGWLEKWHRHTQKVELSMDALKLTPADPVRMPPYRPSPYGPQTPLYTPPYTETSFSSATRERNSQSWQQWPAAREISPVSAVQSESATPDWYRNSMMGFNQHSLAYSNRPLPPLQILPSNHSPYYGNYPTQFTPSPWNQHGGGCGCGYCLPSHERYMPANSYSMQPVVG